MKNEKPAAGGNRAAGSQLGIDTGKNTTVAPTAQHVSMRDTRIAARRRLQDAIVACGLRPHHGIALLAAAESYGKALFVEALERDGAGS